MMAMRKWVETRVNLVPFYGDGIFYMKMKAAAFRKEVKLDSNRCCWDLRFILKGISKNSHL